MTSKKDLVLPLTLMSALMGGVSAPSFTIRGRSAPRRSSNKCPSCRYPEGGATCRKIHETDPRNKKPV